MSIRQLGVSLTPRDKLFFLHIPKTAGSSLHQFISAHFDPEAVLPVYWAGRIDAQIWSAFRSYSYFRGHFSFGWMRRALAERPVTLTMLRDPIERFLSLFAYAQQEPAVHVPIHRAVFERLSVDDYVADRHLVRTTGGIFTGNIDPQTSLLVDDLDEDTLREMGGSATHTAKGWVETARRLLDSFEFVGISERFEESLLLLCYTFGWRPPVQVPRLNVTRRRPRLDHLSAVTIHRIAEYNKLDVELYEHATRLFDERFRRMVDDLRARYGAGSSPDASQSSSRHLVYEWLERHYRHCSVASQVPVRRARVDFTRPLRDPGWHLPDSLPDFGQVCWTGPGTASSIDLVLSAEGDTRIRFRVVHALAPDVLASLALRVNDYPVTLSRQVDDAGTSIFEGLIPKSVIAAGGGVSRLIFRVNRTLVPSEVDPSSADRRALGLAFNWIDLSPT